MAIVDNLIAQQREAERNFCASAIVVTDAVMERCAWLSPEIFCTDKYKNFWKDVGDGVDIMRAGNNPDTIAELMGVASSSTVITFHYEEYARQISEIAYMRGVYSSLVDTVKAIGERDLAKVENILSNIEERSFSTGEAWTPEQISTEFKAMLTGNRRPALFTGLPSLDSLGGLFPQELTILAARPGMGKTAFALQIARSVAWNGKKVLMFSLEMSREQLWARMACSGTGVEWSELRSGHASREDAQKVFANSDKISESLGDNLLIHDEAHNLSEIHKACLLHKPDLVIIDQLPDIEWHNPEESEVTWYGKACKYIRQKIARDLKVPVILVHQLSRKVEERTNKIPILSDLRWSGEIEQRADVVWMAYREDYYYPEESVDTNSVVFQLFVRKNRQGVMNACVIMNYNLRDQWFAED